MLQYSFFKNKRITVFGLGLNTGGVGIVHFLAQAGTREIIVTDIKKREELAASLEKLKAYKNVKYVLGQHRPEDFSRVDMVIKNPVVPWTNEYVKLAEKSNVPVVMDSTIFFALCPAPIIGVTGSKGKTTTAELIAHILEKAGKKVVRVGLGQASVLGQLGKVTSESVVVFELSSWRLSGLRMLKKSPKLAVLTNIYPDHLNYYRGDMARYWGDKTNIFKFQTEQDQLLLGEQFKSQKLEVKSAIQKLKVIPKTWKLHLLGAHNRANAALVEERLDALDIQYRQDLTTCARKNIVTSHAAFGYLADQYGLRVVAISGISPDEEPSIKKLAQITEFVKREGVTHIFFESLVSPKLSKTIAGETGAATLVFDPLEGLSDADAAAGEDYFSKMRANLYNLTVALQCKT